MTKKQLKAVEEIERDAARRDKYLVRYCPCCGRRPEIPFINGGRHIYNGNCDKCQAGFVIHVCK